MRAAHTRLGDDFDAAAMSRHAFLDDRQPETAAFDRSRTLDPALIERLENTLLIAGADAYVAAQLWDLPARVGVRADPRGRPAVVASLKFR